MTDDLKHWNTTPHFKIAVGDDPDARVLVEIESDEVVAVIFNMPTFMGMLASPEDVIWE